MRRLVLVPVLGLLAGLAGCVQLQRSTYEGLRNKDAVERSPDDLRPPMPDFDTYKKERDGASGME